MNHMNGRRCLARLALAALLLTASVAPSPAQQPDAETINIPALIREVAVSERANNRNFAEYTYTSEVTEAELKDGKIVKESVTVYEVYPQFGEAVKRVVSRNGNALSAAEAERETKRVVKELERAERDQQKRREAAAKRAASGGTGQSAPAPDTSAVPFFGPEWAISFRSGLSSGEVAFSLWHFLNAGEFSNPRRVRFHERDAILLDFHPRAGYTPARDALKPYAKLTGRIWIDAADKNIIRLEAWPVPAPGPPRKKEDAPPAAPDNPAVVIEQTRLPDGRWKESLVRLNTYGDRDLFNHVARDFTEQMTDFKRFTTKTDDAKVDAPPPPPEH